MRRSKGNPNDSEIGLAEQLKLGWVPARELDIRSRSRLLRPLVLNQFHTAHQPEPADIVHNREISQRLQPSSSLPLVAALQDAGSVCRKNRSAFSCKAYAPSSGGLIPRIARERESAMPRADSPSLAAPFTTSGS